MRITVDPELCQGHSRCYALAPMLFDVDDYGLATAANGGFVAAEYVDVALLAVQSCPSA